MSKKHTEQTQSERSQSYFFPLFKFHNQIKRQLYNTYTNDIDNLLEIGSGKCGDLNKWISNKIKNVVCYDIDYSSIEEGKRRVNSIKGYVPKVEFNVLDLSKNIIKNPIIHFDIVSAMFCFHYFFESEQTFNTVITSIKNNLKPGGIFIGTIFDGYSLLNLKVPDSDNIELSDIGSIRFKLYFYNKGTTKQIFGNKISVFIKETVLDKPMDEYIVNFNLFVELMKSNGFELINSEMFEFFYNSYKFKNLNSLQKKISFLNRTFVFRYIL